MMIKKIIALFLTIAIATTFMSSCGEQSDLDRVMADKKLIIGVINRAPYDYKSADGSWTGFDAEYASAVCKELGVEPEFVEVTVDNRYDLLNDKTIDCIWSNTPVIAEASEKSDVSAHYLKTKLVAVMKKDQALEHSSIESLLNKKFAAKANSAAEATIIDKEITKYFTSTDSVDAALARVNEGKADVCVLDKADADALAGNGNKYKELEFAVDFADTEGAIGFRKGSDLTKKIDSITDSLFKAGTLTELAKKYELDLILK